MSRLARVASRALEPFGTSVFSVISALARETGARFLTAKALLGFAQLARARGRVADPAHEKEALEIFRDLGLGHYASRAEKLQAAS